jgi:hypothetical protein
MGECGPKALRRTDFGHPKRYLLARLPGEDGWPIGGNTLAALKDPIGHVELMYRNHGPVYRDHLFGIPSVAMLGAAAVRRKR